MMFHMARTAALGLSLGALTLTAQQPAHVSVTDGDLLAGLKIQRGG